MVKAMTSSFTTERHRFDSNGDTLVANLHRPIDLDGGAAPIVVVTGSWTTVKEQQADFYARHLAERDNRLDVRLPRVRSEHR